MPRSLRLVGFVVVVALLGGCGDDDSPSTATDVSTVEPPGVGALDRVTVSSTVGEKPTVTAAWPYAATAAERRVIVDGTGEEVAPGARVTLEYVTIKGADGSELESSFGSASTTIELDEAKAPSAIVKGVIGSKVGSRLLIAVPPSQGQTDTLLFVLDVKAIRRPLSRAEGTPVAPAPDLPAVQLDEKGKPTISIPAGPPPPTLIVQPLITGSGPPVAAGQTITAHYTGVIYGTGRQFDSSWDRNEPSDFAIGVGRVVPGWDEGLVNQPVGSQLLLVIPPDKGYGAEGNAQAGITGTDTLVFVIDILDAS